MESIVAKRIKRERTEVLECNKDALSSIKVEFLDDDFNEMKAEIEGPLGTPYEGGKLTLDIKIPKDYPFRPPKVRFLSKIWHPNVSSVTGAICLDVLKEDRWSAAITLRTLLLTIQVLLSAAEPDHPQDVIVARQFKENHKLYELTARHWTNVYAGGSSRVRELDEKIEQLVEMGLDKNKSRAALSCCDWHVRYAINELLLLD